MFRPNCCAMSLNFVTVFLHAVFVLFLIQEIVKLTNPGPAKVKLKAQNVGWGLASMLNCISVTNELFFFSTVQTRTNMRKPTKSVFYDLFQHGHWPQHFENIIFFRFLRGINLPKCPNNEKMEKKVKHQTIHYRPHIQYLIEVGMVCNAFSRIKTVCEVLGRQVESVVITKLDPTQNTKLNHTKPIRTVNIHNIFRPNEDAIGYSTFKLLNPHQPIPCLHKKLSQRR